MWRKGEHRGLDIHHAAAAARYAISLSSIVLPAKAQLGRDEQESCLRNMEDGRHDEDNDPDKCENVAILLPGWRNWQTQRT